MIAILLVITGIILLASSLTGNKKSSPEEVRAKFDEFVSYLEDGPEGVGEADDEDDWFLFRLDDSELNDTERAEYMRKLQGKYAEFIAIYNKNKNSNRELSISTTEILRVLSLGILPEDFNIQIFNLYISSGFERAQAEVNTELQITSSDEIVILYTNSLREYFTSQLDLLDFYNKQKCLIDENVDADCTFDIVNQDTISTLVNRRESAYNTYHSYAIPMNLILYRNIGQLEMQLESGDK